MRYIECCLKWKLVSFVQKQKIEDMTLLLEINETKTKFLLEIKIFAWE